MKQTCSFIYPIPNGVVIQLKEFVLEKNHVDLPMTTKIVSEDGGHSVQQFGPSLEVLGKKVKFRRNLKEE